MTVDVKQSIDERVRDLLAQMTLDEKLAQLGSYWVTALLDERRAFSPTKAQNTIAQGIGHISRVGAASLLPPQATAPLANAIQRFLITETRLGIPAIIHEEGCAGYMARGATSFPHPIGLGATWEPELIEKMGQVIRTQMRAVGAHQVLAPVLDVTREPRWGRVEETMGEDPFLITQLGTAYIRGVQGQDLREGVAATGKHFVAHGIPEGGRNWSHVHVGPRELREVYLTPFRAAIHDAHLASIMNAYHEVDGVPVGASKEIMTDLLRGELGFDGVVSSDYFTVDTLLSYHRIAQDKQDAARLALIAGIDVELPATDCYGEPLRQAVKSGQIDLSLIDTVVYRILRLKFQLGLFENPYVDTGRVLEVFNTPEQRKLSLQLARKSIVLLKNDGELLPLAPTLDSIAVIGPSADSIRLLQGDYHYPAHLEGLVIAALNTNAPGPMQEATDINLAEHFPPSVSVLQGIKAAVSSATTVHYAVGCEVNSPDTSGFAAAVAAAKQARVAILVCGEKSGLGADCTSGESLDRAEIGLPGVQQHLIEAVHATGTPVVLVLLNGRPLALPWIAEHIPAIVEAWLPAQEGGTAIADILFGKVNPGGRLPISLPRSSGQVPVYYNHKPSAGRSHWHGRYVDMPTTPLFPFGHGLSYTHFTYSNLHIAPSQIRAHETVIVRVEVQNTGAREGDEVVQLYLHDAAASLTRPVQELKGFIRLTLQPGAKRTVTFHVPARHLAFYDHQMRYIVEPGTVEVMVGSSSQDIRLRGTFEITGAVMPVMPVFSTEVDIQ
jgi:beta-glucosidase